MKKFLQFDCLRAVQVLGNTVSKKEIQCQRKKFSANFFWCLCFLIGCNYKDSQSNEAASGGNKNI